MGRLRKGIKEMDDSLNLALPSITAITAGVTAMGVGVAAGSVAMINSAALQAKEMENLSRLANMGVEDFQNYAYATSSVGVEADKLADISKDVQDKLGDFIATGAGPFVDFFENVAPKIGLTAQELQGLSGPDVLIAVQDAMDAVNISAEEQVFYLEAIASDASLLTPLLKDNGAALKEQAARASELGIALSSIESKQLLEAGKATKELTGLFGGLKNKIAAELSPAFVDVTGKIIDGMTDGAGGVDNLAESISIKLLQALGYAVETMRFFHNGWLGIKLVGTVAINAIAKSLEIVFGGVRKLLWGLDQAFELAVKVDALEVNPLDGISKSLETFSASSTDVTKDVIADIAKTNTAYDSIKGTIAGYVTSIKDAGVQEANQADIAQTSADTKKAAIEEVTDKQLESLDTIDSALNDFYADYDKKDLALRDDIASRIDAQEQMQLDSIAQVDTALDDFFSDIDDKAVKTTNNVSNTFTEMSKTVQHTMSVELGEALTESFGNIDSEWGRVWDSMLAKMADVVVQMAASWISSGIGNMFEGWDIFHAGIWDLKDDEVPSILQKGEMVIPKTAANQIRENVNGLNDGDFEGLAAATGNADPAGWGSSYSDIALGDKLGGSYRTQGMASLAGILTGATTPTAALQGLMSPANAMEQTASALIGIGVDSHTPAGVYGGWGANLGYGVASFGLSGTPIGAFTGPLGALLGGYLGDRLGDALDDREFEGIRDAFESGLISRDEAARFQQEAERMDVPSTSSLGSFVDSVSQTISHVKASIGEAVQAAMAALSSESEQGLYDFGSQEEEDRYDNYGAWGVSEESGWSGDDGSSGNSGGDGSTGHAGGPGSDPGSVGFATGGIVNRLMVPAGDDGFAALKFGEGIMDTDTMDVLSQLIKSGNLSSTQNSDPELKRLLFAIVESTRKAAKILDRMEERSLTLSSEAA